MLTEITYSKLLDFVVKALKSVRDRQSNVFVSLSSLMKMMSPNMSFGEVQELGKYLSSRGWANIQFVIGDVMAQITTAGIIYLESKEPTFEKEYEEFKAELKTKHGVEELKVNVADLKNYDPKKKMFDLIDKIKAQLKQDGIAEDFIIDLQIIQSELKKINPDIRLIESKLNNFSNIVSVSSMVLQLKTYFSYTS